MFARELRTTAGGVDILSTFLDAEESPVDFHREMLRYWEERRGDAVAPSLRGFDLASVPAYVLPRLSITDITPGSAGNPPTSHYRYWGSALTDIHGGDYTGKSPADVPPASLGVRMQGGCARLFAEEAPHCEVKEYMTHAGYIGRSLILRLPLSDDGTTVNHGVNVYYFESASPDQPLSAFCDELFSRLGAARAS